MEPEDWHRTDPKVKQRATERFAGDGLDKQFGETPNRNRNRCWRRRYLQTMGKPTSLDDIREGYASPDILASALMALERWLLNLAESGQDLRDITRFSDSKKQQCCRDSSGRKCGDGV